MASRTIQYRFKIEAYNPESIPMSRLAEYMGQLAVLLGSRDNVHFHHLEAGSTVLVEDIEFEAEPKVRERINGVRNRTGTEDAIAAYERINRILREDNGSAMLDAQTKLDTDEFNNVIRFPGRDASEAEKFDSIFQSGSVDGLLIRVGGKDETVPVYLEEAGTTHRCTANRDMAKRLAPLLFEVVRLHGTGKWNRDDFGNWIMESFRITDFEKPDTSSLHEVVSRLRAIKSEIQKMDDPITELDKLRHGSGEE